MGDAETVLFVASEKRIDDSKKKIEELERIYPPQVRHLSCYTNIVQEFLFPKYPDVLATPLFEVFSVTIHNNDPNTESHGRPCEIFGDIQVIDEKGSVFCIYKRDWDDPEIVPLGGTLSLTGQHCGVVSPSTLLKVQIDLKDRAEGQCQFASGTIVLHYMTRDDFDEIRVEDVGGGSGIATVRCTTFESAIVADVEVVRLKNKDGSDRVANVFGRIVARYGNNYGYSIRDASRGKSNFSDVRKDYVTSMLFNKPLNQSVEVNSGTPIGLSRSTVVVPAYSTLIIDIDLWDCQGDGQCQLARGTVELQAKDGGLDKKDVQENGSIAVHVNWDHAVSQLSTCDREGDVRKTDEQTQRVQYLYLARVQSPLASRFDWTTKRLGSKLVEVFSVVVRRDKGDMRNFYGTIMVTDPMGKFFMLNTEKNRCGDAACIVWPHRTFVGPEFEMVIQIRDDEECVVSKGSLGWCVYTIERPISYFDKRLCSVVRGEHGYVAVHYMFLPDALECSVKVSMCGNPPLGAPISVYGRILAYYDECTYSSCYERDYYRCVLFDKPPEKCSSLACGSEVPLSRSVLAVPTESLLVIEAELYVGWPSGKVLEQLGGCAKFKGEINGKFKEVIPRKGDLRGKFRLTELYHIEVTVEFSKVPA